jgi:hypothetical protein
MGIFGQHRAKSRQWRGVPRAISTSVDVSGGLRRTGAAKRKRCYEPAGGQIGRLSIPQAARYLDPESITTS